MTPPDPVDDALSEGRLSDALSRQRSIVAANPADPARRLLLIDLLMFAGLLDEAGEELGKIESDDERWDQTEKALRMLLRAERRRSIAWKKPRFHPDPPPRHMTRRRMAIRALRRGEPARAVRCIDAADDVTPDMWGFLDGQEFERIRDADDRYASLLEAFVRGDYFWFGWEALRKVEIFPATILLDQLYRPARITLKDGSALSARLPLVYPGSFQVDEVFALGTETDHVCPDGGPTRCVGGKLLLVGDVEIPLADCRMIEIR
jgi:type VI secretion system protein ImpE